MQTVSSRNAQSHLLERIETGPKSSNRTTTTNIVNNRKLPIIDGYVATRNAPKSKSLLGTHESTITSPGRIKAERKESAPHSEDRVRINVTEYSRGGSRATIAAPTSMINCPG